MFLTVEKEVRLAHALHPDRPLYVVQADLRDFYPSLSHDLVLEVLKWLGVTERWLSFFRKFLAVRARRGKDVRQVRRGLLLEHLLADVFADCVLFVLDLHV